jgi:VCBS repeat-containing protein
VDGNGGSVAQTASVTINGVNDAPTITTATGGNEGAVTEAGNDDAGAIVGGVPSATGTLASSDVDNGASATWTIVVDVTNATNLGAILIDPTSGDWTYILDQSASDYLAEGEDATETFTATVTDQFGATATQVVSVMITGTNDAPTVAAALAETTFEDDAAFSIDLLADAADVDNGETATLSVQNVTGLVDGVTLSGSTITVDPANAAFQHLGVGNSDVISALLWRNQRQSKLTVQMMRQRSR